jgi:hypothetical protein
VSDRPFQIFGSSIPPLVGHRAAMGQLRRGFTKPNPDHMKIVGARSAGKSVVANALIGELRGQGVPFVGAVRWDLGHEPPPNDADFLIQLSTHVARGLEEAYPEWARFLVESKANALEALKEVLMELSRGQKRILVVLDGLEKPLASGKFTRNLWDNLADLGRLDSLRYLTVSRGKPHELVRDPDSAVSDFWGIFEPGHVAVGCFNDEDLAGAIEQVPGLTLTKGGCTELLSWSNGFPPIVLSILNELADGARQGDPVDAEEVASAARKAFDRTERVLDRLWGELPATAQETQRAVIQDSQIETRGHSERDILQLVERGFSAREGNRLRRPCRLLNMYLERNDTGDGSLRRLFGERDRYLKSARVALELRLSQLEGLDETLRHGIALCIRDLPEHPDHCIANIRHIVARCLELIWQVELPDRRIPSEWFDMWRLNGERSPDHWNGQFPVRGGHKISLLKLMTGTEGSRPVARRITRSTYVLAAAAHGFGDFGQHIDENVIHAATALAAMNVCVELAASLLRDVSQP